MTDIETTLPKKEFSRRHRRGGRRRRREQVTVEFNSDFFEGLPKIPILPSFLWSFLISALSVVNPFLTGLADNSQYQNLYSGWLMAAGQSPYNDFFATNGVLYYLMVFLGYLVKSPILVAVLQGIALFVAGIYFNKIAVYFSRSREVATHLTIWFYLFILCSGFGGVYASLFALPFILTSIWFLIRYFENAVRDESFILYGIDAALVFMIYPKSLLLWVVASLVLFVYNGKTKRLARGIYQFLASIFGFLLVIYSVGYYAFEQQILGTAIQQTFFYNISLQFQYENLFQTLLIVGGALCLSGFLKSFILNATSMSQSQHRSIKVIILLAFLVQLLFIIGNANFEVSQLIILLPYGFVMSLFLLPKEGTAEQTSFAEDEDLDQIGQASIDYLSYSYYLPLLICLLIPARPLLHYLQEGEVYKERLTVTHFIKENTDDKDKIVAWDRSAQVYLGSERLAGTTILTAEPYLNTSDNQTNFVFDFNKNEAKYVVVNKSIPLLDGVKANLDRSYRPLDLGMEHLQIYQKNE